MDDFIANEVLNMIRKNIKISRRKAYRKSKLTKYRAELVKMSNVGGSLGELQFWLRSVKKVTAARSTIYRYLLTLPESHKYGGHKNA